MNYQRSICYGNENINFNVIFLPRKTLAIEVHPSCQITVRAPIDTHFQEIDKRVHRRARWICQQLSFFEQYRMRTSQREYVSGETHLYLGKQYRLKVSKSNKNSVIINSNRIMLSHRPDYTPEQILTNWYQKEVKLIFNEIFELSLKRFRRFNISYPKLRICKMKSRWGSISSRGAITLNPKLIFAPKVCIQYVIIHELCHLKHRNHDKNFYNLLSQKMPNWQHAKNRLELTL